MGFSCANGEATECQYSVPSAAVCQMAYITYFHGTVIMSWDMAETCDGSS